MRRIHKVKTASNIKETYSDEDLEKMRDNCKELRDLAMIDMLASTGMRVGEMVLLNRDDINFAERECVVFGKGDKERIVYFDARAKLHLQEYLDSRADDNSALFVALRAPHERIQIGGIDPNKVNPKYVKYYCMSDAYKGWIHSFNTGSTRGNLFYHEEASNVVIDQHITIIRSLENVSTPEHLYLLLSSGDYSNYFESCVTGSTGMQMLNISAVRDTPVPLPTIEQQEYLSQKVSPLYEMIYRNTHESESLVIIKDTLLPKLMSGELDVSNLDL